MEGNGAEVRFWNRTFVRVENKSKAIGINPRRSTFQTHAPLHRATTPTLQPCHPALLAGLTKPVQPMSGTYRILRSIDLYDQKIRSYQHSAFFLNFVPWFLVSACHPKHLRGGWRSILRPIPCQCRCSPMLGPNSNLSIVYQRSFILHG